MPEPATPEAFVEAYQRALATQDWPEVAPLIHPDAVVTFSNGTRHEGLAAIETAFRRNFSVIKSEEYRVRNLKWLHQAPDTAVAIFAFNWRGLIDGKAVGGSGLGTWVLVRVAERWTLMKEHLGAGG